MEDCLFGCQWWVSDTEKVSGWSLHAKRGGGGVMAWDCIAGKPSRSGRVCLECGKLTTKQKVGT